MSDQGYVTAAELVERLKGQIEPVKITTLKNMQDFMSMTEGAAISCNLPQVLANHAEFVREANLIREGLEHLGSVPRDVQQLIDAFTKKMAGELVENCGCGKK